MQSMQRQFGKLMSKSPGDNAKIAAILHDYEDADKLLGKIIDNTKTLRESWVTVATTQWSIVKEYEGLYDPIVGASEGHGRPSITTPQQQLDRTFKLSGAYSDLKDELVEEVAAIDTQVIRPATEAREYLQPLRKTIKKRENKRLDFEKAQDKVKKLQKKTGRTAKEEAQLSKSEYEMNCASEEFEVADAHLREALPPIIDAIFTLIPHILASHICIQNRLLGLYYTVLHNYCEEHSFPSPPPPMESVVSTWLSTFNPVQKEVEAIGCIAHGKTWRQQGRFGDEGQGRKSSSSSASSRNGFSRTPSANTFNSESTAPTPRTMRIPSSSSIRPAATSDASPRPGPQSSSSSVSRTQLGLPTDFTTATALGASRVSPAYTSSRADSYGHQSGLQDSNGVIPALKKKPPPPPPVKRFQLPEEYVVAQYDFSGGQGDLSFREGDRIRIVKKTQTEQDWWVGELGGVKGNFPANYCKAA
ncbi:Regulator of cytoskeleton and endocytosis RVS167-like protein 1 [Colletotrichum chlorophyti]|uniref:Regulator of cytoskeleton and endocytosis RVS167-like protein 1 n=1 Tax=Colletotrichum chlorophyti TaxID=708187 RepID=A0A1Q8RP47_9PEZI|nr:Regulator of cytoskeleton and endocytosis RVS167-like protein 1 [Colletotrichum chlorophyti]